jgi:hypothetical protein
VSPDEERVRKTLQRGLSAVGSPGLLPNEVFARVKRRRFALLAAKTSLALFVVGGTAYGLNFNSGFGGSSSPASSQPVCSATELGDPTVDVTKPTGRGIRHFGVFLEAHLSNTPAHCQPTFYVELDGSGVLPPDGEGTDADEFRETGLLPRGESPCVVADRISGNLLYSGRHVIGIGVGCVPGDSSSFEVQHEIAFDGESSSRI